MISSIKIVLVAITMISNPNTGSMELQYESVDYFNSMEACNVERKKLRVTNKVHLCLKVDRD